MKKKTESGIMLDVVSFSLVLSACLSAVNSIILELLPEDYLQIATLAFPLFLMMLLLPLGYYTKKMVNKKRKKGCKHIIQDISNTIATLLSGLAMSSLLSAIIIDQYLVNI